MVDLWGTLAPLIIGSALVPIQIIITILLLRTPGGLRTAGAWLAGMTTVRLLQGILFGLVFTSGSDADSTSSGTSVSGVIVATLLLIVAIVFFVTAFRQLFARADEDAPPPKWMGMIESVSPWKAYLLGMGIMAIGPKFWVLTLGAVGAISDASLGFAGGALFFLLFIVLAEIAHIAVLCVAGFAPKQSAHILGAATDWLTRHNRVIMIVLGFVFGAWFLIKALIGLGIL